MKNETVIFGSGWSSREIVSILSELEGEDSWCISYKRIT